MCSTAESLVFYCGVFSFWKCVCSCKTSALRNTDLLLVGKLIYRAPSGLRIVYFSSHFLSGSLNIKIIYKTMIMCVFYGRNLFCIPYTWLIDQKCLRKKFCGKWLNCRQEMRCEKLRSSFVVCTRLLMGWWNRGGLEGWDL
jgi:hypothetical protein